MGEMAKKPILSIALMVSNRKDTIEQCLDSLGTLRKSIPSELIITDTGCDEALHQYLEDRADVVTCFTWCNDFAKARNESVRIATGEWYLYLDDDEWFIDTDEIIQFFQSGDYKHYGYADYVQRNYVDRSGVQYSDNWVSRMIRLEPDTHFESRIHEYLAPTKGNCKGLKSIVHHYGYVFDSEEAAWKHYERNGKLLLEMIEEEPEEVRWRIQLAQEYRAVKQWDKLYELGEKGIDLLKDKKQGSLSERIALGSFYASMIMALKEHKKCFEAVRICEQAKKDTRNTELFQAYLSLEQADVLYQLDKYTEAEKEIAEYFKWVSFFEENEPLFILQEGTAFIGECFDEVMKKKASSIQICCGLKRGNVLGLEKSIAGLEWDKQFVYVYENIMQVIATSVVKYPDDNGLNSGCNDRGEESAVLSELLEKITAHTVLWNAFCEQNLSEIDCMTEAQKKKLWNYLEATSDGTFMQGIRDTYLKYYQTNMITDYLELLPQEAQFVFRLEV